MKEINYLSLLGITSLAVELFFSGWNWFLAYRGKTTLEFWADKTDYEERKFDPYHIICQKGSWYVLGYSHSSAAIRLWAMPRIRNCKVTKDKFSIPKDFKLEDHIDVQMGAWGAGTQKYKVELEFVKGMKTFVMERTWHKGQTIKENPDGSVYLSFETIQLSQAASWVMSFTGGAKVLNPPELKEMVRNAAKEILANC